MTSPSKIEHRSGMKRRISVDDTVESLLRKIRTTMTRLNELWNEVSMEERMRVTRCEHAYNHFFLLLDDIVKAEEDMVAGVYSDIEAVRLEVTDLRRELGLDDFNEASYPPHSVALVKALNKDLDELKKLKDEKLNYQQELINEYHNVCRKMGREPERLLSVGDHLLTQNDLDTLYRKKIDLDVEKQKFANEAKLLQEEARMVYDKIGDGSLCSNDNHLLYTDFLSEDIVFSQELHDSLRKFVEKARADYEGWIQTADFEYNEQMILLKELWDKCAIPESNRIFPERFNPETQSHVDIDAIRKEVAYLHQRYEECRPIYDKLNHWLTLFNERKDLEAKYSSDALFSNRGGSLTAILKRQNQLAKLLPKTLAELHSACTSYEASHGGKCVYVDEMPAYQYAEWVLKEYEEQKEINRRLKQQQKREQLDREVKYGTTPIRDPLTRTRPMAGSMKKSTNRLVQGKKISLSCSKINQSIISPIRTPIVGPKTSSPKEARSVTRALDFRSHHLDGLLTPRRRQAADMDHPETPKYKRTMTMTPGRIRQLWKY